MSSEATVPEAATATESIFSCSSRFLATTEATAFVIYTHRNTTIYNRVSDKRFGEHRQMQDQKRERKRERERERERE
jgi:hypothetical protein